MSDFDVVIVGAGAVGLACGYAFAKSGRSVVVLERETAIGSGVSARNSEVIHAGLHYPTGSLKARLCVAGRRSLYAFLAAHNVAHERCGKLIVATEASEIPALEHLKRQAEINGVEDISWLTGEQARALEPQLNAVAALASPVSGIFDSHAYMFALQGEIEGHGGAVVLASPFEGATPCAEGFDVRVGGPTPARISTRQLIIAAGLAAQACARAVEGFPAASIPQLYYGKGNYFALTGVKAPFGRLIYPPPIPGALGTHYRRDLGGVARFGPDLQFVDHEDYRVDAERAASFYQTVRRFWPGLPDGALTPDYAGIRPKLHGAGEPQGDFVIDTDAMPDLAALFGIESPGLTSSMAIGEEVVQRLSSGRIGDVNRNVS